MEVGLMDSDGLTQPSTEQDFKDRQRRIFFQRADRIAEKFYSGLEKLLDKNDIKGITLAGQMLGIIGSQSSGVTINNQINAPVDQRQVNYATEGVRSFESVVRGIEATKQKQAQLAQREPTRIIEAEIVDPQSFELILPDEE
jgi:hypothetical protein